MKEVTFFYKKSPDRSDSLSVSINYNGDLVFNEGTYYPQLGESEEREVDYYITVAASDKAQLLVVLLQQCTQLSEDGVQIETVETTVDSNDSDERLLGVLQLLYNQGQFRSLDAAEQWLTMQKIPFKKSKWYW